MYVIQQVHILNVIQKDWIKRNDELRETYNKENQIRSKTSMLWSRLCDCSDVYTLVERTIKVKNKRGQDEPRNTTIKKLTFNATVKSCWSFTYCIGRINNTKVIDTHDINVVTPMYNSIEYTYSYSKVS